MQCERLIQLSKNWFVHVKDETMAPARMIQFIKDHVATCDICLKDPDLDEEIEKITECAQEVHKISDILQQLQRTSTFRSIPYIDSENPLDEKIIAINNDMS